MLNIVLRTTAEPGRFHAYGTLVLTVRNTSRIEASRSMLIRWHADRSIGVSQRWMRVAFGWGTWTLMGQEHSRGQPLPRILPRRCRRHCRRSPAPGRRRGERVERRCFALAILGAKTCKTAEAVGGGWCAADGLSMRSKGGRCEAVASCAGSATAAEEILEGRYGLHRTPLVRVAHDGDDDDDDACDESSVSHPNDPHQDSPPSAPAALIFSLLAVESLAAELAVLLHHGPLLVSCGLDFFNVVESQN